MQTNKKLITNKNDEKHSNYTIKLEIIFITRNLEGQLIVFVI